MFPTTLRGEKNLGELGPKWTQAICAACLGESEVSGLTASSETSLPGVALAKPAGNTCDAAESSQAQVEGAKTLTSNVTIRWLSARAHGRRHCGELRFLTRGLDCLVRQTDFSQTLSQKQTSKVSKVKSINSLITDTQIFCFLYKSGE